jgi:hypothetical protein
VVQKTRTEQVIFKWDYTLADEALVSKFILYRIEPGSTVPMAVTTSAKQFRQILTSLGYVNLGLYKFFLTALGVNGMESDASTVVDVELVDVAAPPPPTPPPNPYMKPPAPGNFRVE